MDELKVVRLDETDVVKFRPDAIYLLILGDDEGPTPLDRLVHEDPLHSGGAMRSGRR